MGRNYKPVFEALFKEVGRVIVGQDDLLEQVMIALLCDNNALLEGYPGLAKTLAIKTLSEVIDLKFSRIQNTPDLMPSDITGTYILEESGGKRNFRFQPGPVFANIVLADEINRATPKSQSALLEAMQEKQVTIGDKTFKLDIPFFVLATQNPIEQEGSLGPNERVFFNGGLKSGFELLEMAKGKAVAEDAKGIKLFDLSGTTLSLSPQGELEEKPCLLYGLPYSDELIEVTTRTGRAIKVTKNHPFLVNDRGEIRWKKAEELTKEDFLVSPAKIKVPKENVLMSDPIEINQGCRIPFGADFAFWIACVLSDGWIGKKDVAFCQKNYPNVFERFVAVSKSFGFDPKVSERRGCSYAVIHSKALVDSLKVNYGINSGKKKETPSSFLAFPDDMNREFLRTFISLESSLRDNRITFTQKSRNNIDIISYMLLREGIISWMHHDGRIFRLKIQGQDFGNFLKRVGWASERKTEGLELERAVKSSFRVVPVDRMKVLRLVSLFGFNSFHTLKGRKPITSRPWYCSYKGVKEGELVMSVDSLKSFVEDFQEELDVRKTAEFKGFLDTAPRRFAAGIGAPMTEVAGKLGRSNDSVWKFYNGEVKNPDVRLFLEQRHSLCLIEAGQLLSYCKGLLSQDVMYDRIKAITYYPSQGMAFGLTVPGAHNYVGGFGACGISHNTYPLPEAQSDRFLLKIKVSYPNQDEELKIIDRFASEESLPRLKKVLNKQQILHLQQTTRLMPIANDIKKRVVRLINYTRSKKDIIQYGASPRASIGIVLAAKARALMNGRNYVSNEDIEALAYPILRHRIILNFEAERKGLTTEEAIKEGLAKSK